MQKDLRGSTVRVFFSYLQMLSTPESEEKRLIFAEMLHNTQREIK